jgi:hypothetical protein
MGYRELLKKYILHLELTAGDHFIEADNREPVLSSRDLGELRTLAAEINRDAWKGADADRVANFNHRLRVLMNRHGLSASQLAGISGIEVGKVRRWRTSPKSSGYLPLDAADYAAVEQAVIRWLERASA